MTRFTKLSGALLTFFTMAVSPALPVEECQQPNARLIAQWPDTDFSECTVRLSEVRSGGIGRDVIPSIDQPEFIPVSEETELADQEPVISLTLNGVSRAWPLRILTWHEIVNDELGGVPVAVTYCPLCNAAIVFERETGGKLLDFGTTGNLRNSDLVMYDRQTESWWQQYTGEAIFGELTGTKLRMLPARIEAWQSFKTRNPDADVLVPNNPGLRAYGSNPYVGYDTAESPFLYNGTVPEGIAPMERVVVVDDRAVAVSVLMEKSPFELDGFRISWEAGQNSALDTRTISEGRDVGSVRVRKKSGADYVDHPHHVTFAFVFHAFNPGSEIITKTGGE